MLASLNVHREVTKTVVAEGMEAGQCPGVSVALQTDRTSQLLLQLLESFAGGGGFLCHWVTATGVSIPSDKRRRLALQRDDDLCCK